MRIHFLAAFTAHESSQCPCPPVGVTVARKIKKMGMRASDTAEIYFDDVRVPVSNIIGDEGMGFKYQMMQVRRVGHGFVCLICLTSMNVSECLHESFSVIFIQRLFL